VPEGEDMAEEEKTLEERMTPEERELFESYRQKIGQETVTEYLHEMFFPIMNDEHASWPRIKKWAIINGDLNALWFDEEYARKSRWSGIIAPPLFLMTIVNDGGAAHGSLVRDLYKPGPECIINREKYPTFRGSMQANSEWEFFEPVRPGDTITVKDKPTAAYWKQGKRLRLLLTFSETTYTNQKGQPVARNRDGAVYMFK